MPGWAPSNAFHSRTSATYGTNICGDELPPAAVVVLATEEAVLAVEEAVAAALDDISVGNSTAPEGAGGGSVFYVTRNGHRYVTDATESGFEPFFVWCHY